MRILLIPLIVLALQVEAAPSTVEITSAEYTLSDARLPPSDAADWKPLELPFAPRGARDMPRPSVMWVRFDFERPDEVRDLALYIWRHNVSLEVFMNGARIGGMRPDASPTPIAWNIPLLFNIQPGNWQTQNQFHIRLQGGVFGSMLSTVLVGPESTLRPQYEKRYFWQVETSKWTFNLSVLLGVFTLWLWTRRRQDSMYLLFAASCFSWATLVSYFYLDFLPLPLDLWLGIVHTAGGWCSFFLVCFINRAAGFIMPRLERAMMAVVSLGTVLHFFYPATHFFIIAYTFHAIGLGFLMFVGAVVIRDAFRRPGEASTWFSFAFLSVILLLLHDWYFFMSSPKDEYVQASNLMQLAIPMMLAMLFAHLVNRFVSALNESEDLNRDLESRVDEHRRKLEESFQQNRMMEIHQGAAKEREKIYRDLHDDVGSKLVSIVHSSTESREVELARAALESLREAIYRANYQDQSLADFADDIQVEMRVRAENAGLDFSWQQADLPDIVLPSDICYHVTRILREILSNTLHHSRATSVDIRVDVNPDEIRCVIRDNGIGFDIGNYCGNGIKNVRYRADQIGGHAEWCSLAGKGTEVTLVFDNPDQVSA